MAESPSEEMKTMQLQVVGETETHDEQAAIEEA